MNQDARDWVPLFPDEEIPHILDAITRCMQDIRKSHPLEHETHITKRLCIKLKADPLLRNRPVWPDREVVEDDNESDAEGRLDLRFLLLDRAHKPPPYFAVEAKRLHVTYPNDEWRSLVTEYVKGKQGMMCFINGKYSKGLLSGAMLGYVFDGDVSGATQSIREAITKTQKTLCFVREESNRTDKRWKTVHHIGNQEFAIFHVIAEV